MLLGERGKRLERALQDALGPDVDPAARGHLAIHHQAFPIELMKMLPVGPLADKIGVGDDDAGSHLVGGKNADGFAGLHEECVFVSKLLKLVHDGMKAVPVARGLADAAVDHQVRGAFAHFRVEIIHQAAEGCLLLPAFAAQLGPARRSDRRSSKSHRGVS